MRRLMILRHASAVQGGPHIADHARPLDAVGRDQIVRMRQLLRRLVLMPDLVLVSSARRTLETLQLLEPWQASPLVRRRDALYLASANTMLDVLRETEDHYRHVLIVGHNPGLHDLARQLAGPDPALPAGFPTAGLAVYEFGTSWRDLRAATCHLAAFHHVDTA